MLEIGAGVLRNAVTPLALRILGDRRRFGIDSEPEMVRAALDWLAEPLAALDLRLHGRTVLELGPGRTPDLGHAFALAGAADVVGLDTVLRMPDRTALSAALVDWLTGPSGGRFLDSVGATPDLVQRRATRFVSEPLPVRFDTYTGHTLPFADASVDLVISKSVLEHVRIEAVTPLLAELRRVLTPDAAMVHLIDLRDPTRITGDHQVNGDWLNALRYSEPVYRSMYSARSTLINRLREPQWRTALTEAGFQIEHWRVDRFPLPAEFDPAQLRPPWSTSPVSELDIGWITLAARPAPR